MAITERRLTLDEFLRLPEEKPALEYMHGVVTQKVSPKGSHSTLQGVLYFRITSFAEPRRLAKAYTELRTTFGGESTVPDLAVYRWDRVPRRPDGRVAEDFTLPPDIAIEIRSPGQTRSAQEERCRWYVENGAEVALLVDPLHETVTVFRRGSAPRVLRGADLIDFGTVLPGLVFSVEELFASLRE